MRSEHLVEEVDNLVVRHEVEDGAAGVLRRRRGGRRGGGRLCASIWDPALMELVPPTHESEHGGEPRFRNRAAYAVAQRRAILRTGALAPYFVTRLRRFPLHEAEHERMKDVGVPLSGGVAGR